MPRGLRREAINPYLAFETLIAMKDTLPQKLDDKEIVKRYIKSLGKGLMKVMSKMGISTYQLGEPREVHHFACLAGYGAEAMNPYLAFETLVAMKETPPQKLDDKELVKRYIKSIGKGLMKVMSKMGISTYQSYCGAHTETQVPSNH